MLLDSKSAKQLTQSALAIAHDAGRRIVEIYEQDYTVSYKADDSPVTTADLAANDIIVNALKKLPIVFPIISEECEQIPFAQRHDWTHFWLVDPLDGTREFIKRNGEFSINIALVVNGEPLLGVVTAPVLGLSYYATRGQGAWKQVGQQLATPIHVRKAPTGSGELTLARSRCPTVGPLLQTFLDKLGDHKNVAMGCSLKSCLVAEGMADLYVRLGPTSEWDTAAAQCIVEEAGGHVTDTKLRALKYNMGDSLLNPHFMVFGDNTHDWGEYLTSDAG